MKKRPDTPPPVGDFSQALRRNPMRETAGYVAAGATVLALHASVAAWAMQTRPEPMSDAPPAENAVMIDLAPEPVAPIAEETQVSEDMNDTPPTETEPIEPPNALEQVESVDTPDPVEDAPPPDEPSEQVAEIDPMAPAAELPEIDTAEAVLPPARPKPERVVERPVEKPVEQKKPAPPKKVAEKEQRRATASAPSQSAAGSKKWQSRLMAHLERRKRFPAAARRRGDQGTATVRFTIDTGGGVQSVSLVRSSGVPELDEEAVAMVRRASPVPAPPPGSTLVITVPVRFNVRG